MSRVPVLAILGSTGSGKSRLAIELARRFSGEIISADSMQVYKGLDIITAKVTEEERAMATHHMLDIVHPLNTNFTVVQFRDMAVPIIDDLLANKKLPIVVGGTNYYIESLLWKILIADDDPREDDYDTGSKKMKIEIDRFTDKSNEELFKELMEVDPEMANRMHPNNRRKIIRSLEVFKQRGVKHSDLLKAQRTAGGCGLGGPLRHPNSILLWLRCDKKVLDARLEDRVDRMVANGLVQELLHFHRRYNEQRIKSNTSADYTKGIFQSIGFKEFHDYLVSDEEKKRTKQGEELLKKGMEDLKLVTKRYAKNQEKWVKNRIIRRGDRQVPPVYVLDSTNVDQWNSCVLEPAITIIEAALRGEKPERIPLNETVENQKSTDSSNEEKHYCNICERVFIGQQWNLHLGGGKHKRCLRRKKIMEERIETEITAQENQRESLT